MIVLIGGVKGGSGRSTLSTNLAAWLAGEGRKLALLDTDKQMSSSKWASRRDVLISENKSIPKIFCPEKRGDGVGKFAIDLEDQFGIVLIDAGGRDSAELRSAMTVADILIIPMAPSQFDMETLEDFASVVTQSKGFNPNMRSMIVINRADKSRGADEFMDAVDALKDLPGFELSKNFISNYKIYRTAIAEGLGVIELNNSKAKAEIQMLAQEVFNG